MSQPKPKTFPIEFAGPVAGAVAQSCLGILAINWVFQGVRGMDSKERSFRLLLETAIWLLATAAWIGIVSGSMAVLLGLVTAHSINFFINGQFWVCVRYCRFYRNDRDRLSLMLCRMLDWIKDRPWLHEVVVIGSSSSGAVRSDRSDIDLRLIMASGFLGWLQTNLLLVRLRLWALWQRIPLDLYAYDDPESLDRFNQDEPIWIAKDGLGRLHRRYQNRRMVYS